MKKLIALFISLSFFSCITPQIAVNKNADFSKIKRVAVLNFHGPMGEAVSDIITTQLLKHQVDVVERQQLSDIIKELNISKSEFIDPQTRKKMQKILSVDAIITGNITKYKPPTKYLIKNNSNSFNAINEIKGKNIYIYKYDPSMETSVLETTLEMGISFRMIDIETGSILFSGYMSYEGLDMETVIETISEYFIKHLSRYWKEIRI